MDRRYHAALLIAFAFVCFVPGVVVAQIETEPRSGWTPPRTPEGVPDLQGVYTFRTITPMQRPEQFEGRATLSPEEAAAFEAAENTRLNRDLFDPIAGAPSAGYAPRAEGGVLSYNEFWYERGVELTRDKRTSLIVDPPDGRIPYTAAAREKNRVTRANLSAGFADSYTDRSLADRCLMGFNSGPPMVPSAYNNNVMILQTPGRVVIYNEMIHNARIIPTDGSGHGDLRQWVGDSRARWEGDVLVIETRTSCARPPSAARRPTPASSSGCGGSIRTPSCTSSRWTIRIRSPVRGPRCSPCGEPTGRCSSTPATRATTAWKAFWPGRGTRTPRPSRGRDRTSPTGRCAPRMPPIG